MDSKGLLECLDGDFRRLREVAGGTDLAATVPSCPEWSVAELVRHVAHVYLHKVECMRLGTHPEPWPPAGLDEEEPLALLDRAYAALTAEFTARDATSPAFTWYGPDQTVGFWIRRMAQETVVHRVDTELGAGVPIAPIDPELAVDGIDEFLVAFVEYGSVTWPEEFAPLLAVADGRAVRVRTADAAWLLRLTPDRVEVSQSSDVDAAAEVTGAPVELLLWLWNRGGEQAVATTGDADLVAYLRPVLAAASG